MRNPLNTKKGAAMPALMSIMAILVIMAVLVAGLAWFGLFDKEKLSFGNGGGDSEVDLTGKSCEIAPSIVTPTTYDRFQQGTSVTHNVSYLVNGVPGSVTSLSAGDKVQPLFEAVGYIDFVADEIQVDCGANRLTNDGSQALLIADYSQPTLTIKEDSTTLTDNKDGGAANASSIAAGGSDTYDVVFNGVDKDVSGQMLYVVELSSSANVSSVTMSTLSGSTLATQAVPSFYTDTLTSPYKIGFIVPSVENAVEVTYKLNVASKSGKQILGAVYTTAYVGEALQEDDGSFTEWAVAKADGTSDNEANFDYDFYIDAS